MPTDEDAQQPLLRPSYLLLLGGACVVMLWMNPGVLRRFMPRRTSRSTFATSAPAQTAARAGGFGGVDVRAIQRDLDMFSAWFLDETNTPAASIEIRQPVVMIVSRLDPNPTRQQTMRYRVAREGGEECQDAVPLRQRLSLYTDPGVQAEIIEVKPLGEPGSACVVSVRASGIGRVGLVVDDLPPVFYDLNIRAIWPLAITGTVYDDEAGWLALADRRTLEPGAVIPPPDELRCGYKVLSVSRRCVWLAALEEDLLPFELPTRALPELQRVVLSPDMAPQQIEIKSGAFLAPGDYLTFPGGARLTVERLWMRAVHLRYHSATGGERVDMLCVIVR